MRNKLIRKLSGKSYYLCNRWINPGLHMHARMKLGAICLDAWLAMPASVTAADGESTVFRNDLDTYISLQLPGDTKPTTLTANWEAELTNKDGNQNQMSMAKCGDDLFVCISYYDDIDDRKGALFLRRYSALDGTADEMTIALPEDFQPQYADAETFHAITSDSNGNLVAMLLDEYINDTGTKALKITLYHVDLTTRMLDSDSRIEIEIPTDKLNPSPVYNPWMERIDSFKGDFLSGVFCFGATMGWRDQAIMKKKFLYSHQIIDYDITRANPVEITDKQIFIFESTTDQNHCPDIVPLSEGSFVVTRNFYDGEYYPPTIYTVADGKTTDTLSDNWGSNAEMAYCRGFYPFIHNGHTLALFGQRHDTTNEGNGAAYCLINLPGKKTFNGYTPMWDFPATSFPSGEAEHPVYQKFYRQLAVVEVPQASAADADDEGSVTNIYICSPGTGIGSYTLATKTSTPTSILGIGNDADEAPMPVLQGRTLYLSAATDALTAELFDTTGRHIASLPASGTEIDLSSLSTGLYIVRTGSHVIKICLH